MALKRPWRRVSHAHDVPATSRLGVTQVVKLHGDAAPPRERAESDSYRDVVLSQRDYDDFASERAAFDLLLAGLMLNHTFLFVGYSVSDENVKATWTRILDSINQRSVEAGRHRQAYGLAFDGKESPVQGLDWIPNPGVDGASRARAQWRLLDALAEYVTEPAQLLARDASGDSQLSSVQTRLNETAAAVVGTLARSKRLRADETHALSRIAELLYDLGWKPDVNTPALWERLADAASERSDERRELLELALAHATSAAEADRLRALLWPLR